MKLKNIGKYSLGLLIFEGDIGFEIKVFQRRVVCSLATLRKYDSIKNKMLLVESLEQRLLVIFTALSPFYVGQPYDKASAMTNYPTICCKSYLESSAAPIIRKKNLCLFHNAHTVTKGRCKGLYVALLVIKDMIYYL